MAPLAADRIVKAGPDGKAEAKRRLPQPSLRKPPPFHQPGQRAVPCHVALSGRHALDDFPAGKMDVASALDAAPILLGRFPNSEIDAQVFDREIERMRAGTAAPTDEPPPPPVCIGRAP
jgi:hypothetical protein